MTTVVTLDAVSVVYTIVAGVTGGIAVLAWRNRPSPGARTLSVLMAAVAAWNVSLLGLDLVSTHFGARVMFSLVFVAPAVTTAAFFAFALEYTGYERYLRRPYVYLLAIEPILVAVFTATNPLHYLFWSRPGVYSTADIWSFVPGLGSSIHLIYAYALVAVGTLLILRRIYSARAVHKRQGFAILIGVIAPWFGNILFVVGVTEVGQVAGFAVTGVVVYWAITEYRLVDLTPVARATVMDELEVGVLVIDSDLRVTDINRFCLRLFDVDSSTEVIGRPVDVVLDGVPELERRIDSAGPFETTVTTTVDGETRTLSVRASTLRDDIDRVVGRLLLFEDITSERRRQQEIEQRNEQLQEFASMVSHDIRNPLDVASGYVELMRESRTEVDDGVRLDLDKLDETADALVRIEAIVDDVLTLAREGETATNPETVSLRSAARAAWDHVATADAKLVIGTDSMVVADREQLERVFENLFRNAVEHGGSDVTVSIGTISGTDGFYVEDDGPGIPEQKRETVLNSGVTDAEGGTGFGLAIVDQLASGHGWAVSISDSEEGGARFEFTDVEFTTENVPPERQSP